MVNMIIQRMQDFMKFSKRLLFDFINFSKRLLFEPSQMLKVGIICIVAEMFINGAIIETRRYTEIDWKAYMNEVEGFLNGTFDYSQLKGDTGPLVYPAGFVYVFSALYHVTDQGTNIKLAQYLFGFIYIMFYGLIVLLYKKVEIVPPYVLFVFTFASYRIHSIFALRLFNDPIAILFLYIAVYMFIQKKWLTGCAIFSFAVSIKMNVMLYSPGLLYILLVETGVIKTCMYISLCAGIQLLLGLPFLLDNPYAYIKMSFDLGRQFFFKWTVNYRFIPESIFLSRNFHFFLLLVQIGLLIAIFVLKWSKAKKPLSPKSTLLILFSSNFIGIACARSLHYQFYVWYYHTLPLLLFSTKLPEPVIMLILLCVEICWNTYPSTVLSSTLLQLCHVVGVIALLLPDRNYKLKSS